MNSKEINRLADIAEQLITTWNKVYVQELSNFTREHTSHFKLMHENIIAFEKSITSPSNNIIENVLELHTANLGLLKDHYSCLNPKNGSKEFTKEIEQRISKEIHALPICIPNQYNNDIHIESENKSSRFLWKLGSFFYHVRNVPLHIKNTALALLKREKKVLPVRIHNIYFQSIVKGFLVDRYLEFLLQNTYDIQKKIIHYSHLIYELESQIIEKDYVLGDTLNLEVDLPQLDEQFTKINNFYPQYKEEFKTLLEKSGTWEFPLFYMRYRLKKSARKILPQIDTAHRLWNSTFYAFCENWRFREELFKFVFEFKKRTSNVLHSYSAKLNKTLIPLITNKRESLLQLIDRIPAPDNCDLRSLKHFYTNELYKRHKESLVEHTEEDLNKACLEIEKLLHKIKLDTKELLETLPNRSGVVRSPNYEKGVRKSEIYYFSPSEFVEIECVPSFIKKVEQFIQSFNNSFNEIVLEFSDFDQISDFTIDTALSMIETQNHSDQIVILSKEGMKRSLNILERNSELCNDIINKQENVLNQLFIDFINNVVKISDNDRILNIYSSLIRSKAIKKSKENRQRISKLIYQFNIQLTTSVKERIPSVVRFYTDVRKKLKLDKAPVYVSSEISNYLLEINKRIYNLPMVYRYLFENAPVKEVNLFLSRERELSKLDDALKDWKAQNYAATLIIGENGSGKSSLITYFIKNLKGSYHINYHLAMKFYSEESDFYVLMQDVFNNKDLTSDQKILEEIQNTKGQPIIVIDGLERLFLRSPGGFACMHKLLAFIISTNEYVFWVCSISMHASNYLDKTIALKENFDHILELKDLSSEAIKDIVLKRHRLSGYTLRYDDEMNASLDKTKERIRQEQLEVEFFNELNKFSNSNISLSLYFWLESISDFTDKEFQIKKFEIPDFSFLESLSSEKVYALLLIVLHGKMTLELYARVCNQSIERSRKTLTILKEDSILILIGDYYKLNGVLYRHVIQLLKNKNLIH